MQLAEMTADVSTKHHGADSPTLSVQQLAGLLEVFGGMFARVFPAAVANFVAELVPSLEARGIKLADLKPEDLERLASRNLAELMPHGGGETGEANDLASAPEWIRQAYRQAKEATEYTEVSPAEIRAKLIRNRIVLALKKQGMTQGALAKQLGKSDSQMSRILAKPERIKLDTLAQIARAVGVEPPDILGDFGTAGQEE